MKKAVLIFLNVLQIVPFIVSYKQGALVTIYMMPVCIIVSIINTVFSKSIIELIRYNCLLIVVALLGTIACGQLYFVFVYKDSAGELVLSLEMLIMAICLAAVSLIECLIKKLCVKRKK